LNAQGKKNKIKARPPTSAQEWSRKKKKGKEKLGIKKFESSARLRNQRHTDCVVGLLEKMNQKSEKNYRAKKLGARGGRRFSARRGKKNQARRKVWLMGKRRIEGPARQKGT